MGDVVDAKIAAATPAVKAILEKVDEAIQAMIEKAQAHIETGKAILVDLLDTIIARIAELKDSIAGYSILDDLLNDVLKPALKNAIENLIPTISKHLGDLADKLVGKTEYVSFDDIKLIAEHIKAIFEEIKAKIESGEVKGNVIEFLKKMKAVIDAKITAAEPVVTAALEKVKAAIDELINKAIAEGEAAITQGKGLLVNLLDAIMAKLAELKDELTGFNLYDDLLNDVLKPALKNAIESLIPAISKLLGDLADKLAPQEYVSFDDFKLIAQHIKAIFDEIKAKIESGEVKDNVIEFLKNIFNQVKAKIESGEIKDSIVDFLQKLKDVVDEKIAEAIQAMIEKAKAHIETGKAILVDLLDTIIAKIAELKDSIAGYSILD